MSYSPEQVEACILAYKAGDLNYCRAGIIDLLTAYAATLRQQAGRVDDGMVRAALSKLVESAVLMLAEIDTCGHEVDPAYRLHLYEAWEQGKAALAQPTQAGEAVAWLCQAPDDGTRTAVIAKALADMVERNGWTVQPLYLHAERARVPAGMVLVPQQFVDKVRAASQPFTHPRAVPVLIEEAMDALEAAAPSQRAEVK